MPDSVANGATLRGQTCIEPDRIALLARDVSQLIRSGLRGSVVQFDGAVPGQLAFSIRSKLGRSELMSFRVDITRREDGFTIIDVHMPERRGAPVSSADSACAVETPPPGYDTYKRYAHELAAALTRFDPQSTAILVETTER